MARRRTKMPSFCSSGTSHLTFSSRIRRQQPSQSQMRTDMNTSSRPFNAPLNSRLVG
jgi:hypothetical protein